MRLQTLQMGTLRLRGPRRLPAAAARRASMDASLLAELGSEATLAPPSTAEAPATVAEAPMPVAESAAPLVEDSQPRKSYSQPAAPALADDASAQDDLTIGACF
mmetsp:Transcript_21148/g.68459  ORF Transcript_21148/g.68459 Transcript_21148/m.68459 type:complete len:104 (+) Transcript_21148:396-707(+)